MAGWRLRLSGLGAMALTLCSGAVMLTMALVVAGVPASTSRVQAQSGAIGTGYTSCAGSECHTKSGQIEWLTSKPGGQEHRASFTRLTKSADVSAKYAKAVGLADFKDPAGMCMKCHGRFVAKAKTYEGVGCEGCHGSGTGYLAYHSQTPTDYKGAVQRGLNNLQRQPAAWIRVCRDCHVLVDRPEYEKLLDAEHKDGKRWIVAKKYEAVQTHWKKVTYTAAMITDAAAGKVFALPAPIPPAPTPIPPAPAPIPPAPVPIRPAPAPIPPAPAPIRPAPAPIRPAPAPIPPAPAPIPPAPAPIRPAPAPIPPAPAPIPPAPAPIPPPAAVGSPLSFAPPQPVSAAGLLAALQDRVAGLLASLLRSNLVPSAPVKPLGPAPVLSGPDADLLRLQYEALGLAVEALNLRAKPTVPGPPK